MVLISSPPPAAACAVLARAHEPPPTWLRLLLLLLLAAAAAPATPAPRQGLPSPTWPREPGARWPPQPPFLTMGVEVIIIDIRRQVCFIFFGMSY